MRHYLLWKVVRASTAAPHYFDPEEIIISEQNGANPVVGEFVDGGVSPFNNPSLQAFMQVTLGGYNISWKQGKDNLLVTSVGTGKTDPSQDSSKLAAVASVRALLSLMDDCGALVETMMQWMSESSTASWIDREVNDLSGDLIGTSPRFTYHRYNLALTRKGIADLDFEINLDMAKINRLGAMDNPDIMESLYYLGSEAAKKQVGEDQFPEVFDLGKTD